MKVLVVGYGSIGRRHVRNLACLGEVTDIFIQTKQKDFPDYPGNKNIEIVHTPHSISPDIVLVCNETYKHIETALYWAKKGVHLFIEKPLTHSQNGITQLARLVKRKKLKLCLGYNMRFLGAIRFVKDLLKQRKIGKLYFAKIEAGQYLPSWRKGRDYRLSYSVSKKRGGGVALDLSHEIDYMRYFFGDPHSWKVAKAKVSNLKIDSEDIFEGIYLYDNFVCNVHLDYLQKNKRRIIRIEGHKGTLTCDLIKKNIIIEANGRKRVVADKKLFDLDKTYVDEISNFINSVKKDSKPEVTFEDGVSVLGLIED